MSERYLLFDMETERIQGSLDLDRYVPRVTVAATLTSDNDLRLWCERDGDGQVSGAFLAQQTAQSLVAYLADMDRAGYTIVTWNGAGFDFRVLANASGARDECADLAWRHTDMMFWFHCQKGYPIQLAKAAEAVGSAKTAGNQEQYSFLAEFDMEDDGYGYDTGLELVRIVNQAGEQDSVEIRGHYYHYKWVNQELKNGWPDQAVFAITSYDRGDESTGLESLESSKNENRVSAIPGTLPSENADVAVTVYPNPYRVRAAWDGSGQSERLIWFRNLPENSTIQIYTLAGDLVDEINHTGYSYSGGDVNNLPAQNTVLAGGEHPWDLLTMYNEPVATGMYVFTVKNEINGNTQVGKFLVIK